MASAGRTIGSIKPPKSTAAHSIFRIVASSQAKGAVDLPRSRPRTAKGLRQMEGMDQALEANESPFSARSASP